MSEMKYGKYKGEEIKDIALKDPKYLYWVYGENTKAGRVMNHDFVTELDQALDGVGFQRYVKPKKEPLQFYLKMTFGKYKGMRYDDIVIRDAKYLWFLYGENERKKKPNEALSNSIIKVIKENGCIIYDTEFKKKGLEYCKGCKMMHTIK